jgi:MFS transporter, ACS family, D-galactonate transporter
MTIAQRGLLALLVVSIFLNYLDRSNLSLAAPMMAGEFSLSPVAMGSLFSAFFWTYALLQLFGIAGWLADRYRPGVILAAGLLLWSGATVATGFGAGLAGVFAARLLVGAGESVAYPCYCRLFATHIPAEHRGVANALLDAGSKLGPALGTFAGGLLLARTGWRWFFIALGTGSMLWLIPWLRWMPRGDEAVESGPACSPATVEILGTRSAWGAFLGHFCGNYFWFFLLTWLPTYLVKERGFSTERMADTTAAAFLAIAGATLAAGWISDRWIAAGGSHTRVRKTMVVGGLLGSTIILPVAAVRDPAAAIVLLYLSCMAFGTFTSNHWAITQTLAGPTAAGRWTSLQNGIGNLAGIAASWFTGFVVEQTRSFAMAFVAAAVVVSAGALFWGLMVGPVRQVEWGKRDAAA